MTRFLGQRPFLSGKIRQKGFVRDAIARRDLVGPNDVEPSLGAPAEDLSIPEYLPDGSRRWRRTASFQSQIIAFFRSQSEFPAAGQALTLDFVTNSYFNVTADGGVEPRFLEDLVDFPRTVETYEDSANGVLRRAPGLLPRFRQQELVTGATGLIVNPAGYNHVASPNIGDPATWRTSGVTISAIPAPELQNLMPAGSPPVMAYQLTEIVSEPPQVLGFTYNLGLLGTLQNVAKKGVSLFVKPVTSTFCRLRLTGADLSSAGAFSGAGANFNLDTQTAIFTNSGYEGSISSGPDGWSRISLMRGLETGNNNRGLSFGLHNGPTEANPVPGQVRSVLVAMPQYEEASVFSSYMPGLTARDDEAPRIKASAISEFFNPLEGAIMIEHALFKPEHFYNPLLFALLGDTDNNMISLSYSGTELRALIRRASINVLDTVLPVSPSADFGRLCKDFISWGPDGVVVARNGSGVALPAVALPDAGAITRGLIGGGLAGFGNANGVFRRILYFSEARDAGFASALTAI